MKRKQRRQIKEGIDLGIKKRKELAEFNSFLKCFRTKEIEINFGLFNALIYFSIGTLKELKDVRKMLRREFGTWEDELEAVDCWHSITYNDYFVIFKWLGKHLPIRIDLETRYKDLPEELKSIKEGCRFKETITPIEAQGAKESKVLSYICETK